MTLMFKPAIAYAIFVPLASVKWSWAFDAKIDRCGSLVVFSHQNGRRLSNPCVYDVLSYLEGQSDKLSLLGAIYEQITLCLCFYAFMHCLHEGSGKRPSVLRNDGSQHGRAERVEDHD